MNKELIQKVFKTENTTTTINIFQYGNGYRVKYTLTNNDENLSRLLNYSDDFFMLENEALKKFNELINKETNLIYIVYYPDIESPVFLKKEFNNPESAYKFKKDLYQNEGLYSELYKKYPDSDCLIRLA
jgi:hypothetical protein